MSLLLPIADDIKMLKKGDEIESAFSKKNYLWRKRKSQPKVLHYPKTAYSFIRQQFF